MGCTLKKTCCSYRPREESEVNEIKANKETETKNNKIKEDNELNKSNNERYDKYKRNRIK